MLPLWIIDLSRDPQAQEHIRTKIESLPGAKESWRHTTYADIDLDSETWFADFVQELVKSGQDSLRDLKSIKPINECCMNICVLGDATEEYTLKFFSSVAAIIKKEKARIIPNHVHQGINILGMLFVPSDIHNQEFDKRQRVLRCLKELDVQQRVNLAAGYDRVMLYQDTQRRTAKFYPLLNKEQRLDYLLQCILHLYYICDSTHPLLDGNGGGEDFFFSMGVGSLYYDTNEQDAKDLRLVGNNIMSSIKEKGTADVQDHEIRLFDPNMISTSKLFDILQVNMTGAPDTSSVGVPRPPKDPVENFNDKHLIQFYYHQYIKTYPTKLMEKVIEKIGDSTKEHLEKINSRVKDYYNDTVEVIQKKLRETIKLTITPEVGCLTLIKKKINDLKESIAKVRSAVDEDAEVMIWNEIIENKVPKRLHDAFNDYHGCFKHDEINTGANSCENKKSEVTAKLTALMKHEPTIMSTLARSFLAGVILVLAVMPVLESISPALINLGNVKSWAFLWAGVIFLIPLFVKYFQYVRFNKKKQRLCDQLIAFYLHDAYARLVNRAKNQVYEYYDKLSELCSEYIKRCDTIIDAKELLKDKDVYTLDLPKTMFNQPVIEGKCCGITIFPDSEINKNLISVRGYTARVDSITKKQHYAIVQDFPDLFMMLFRDVKVYDRVYRNTETQEVLSRSDEDIINERNATWEAIRAEFQEEFAKEIKTIFIPRTDTTVAQKLALLASQPENQKGFEIFTNFCETSGEFTANDDIEFADMKTNSITMQQAFAKHLPMYTTVCQVNEDEMYRSSFFLTRWRTFDHISPSRILPETELMDRDIFLNWKKPPKSSLILYALIGDMSAEWHQLFTHNALIEVPDACAKYKEEVERHK